RTIAGLVDLDLGEIVVGAWRRHRALAEAAHATQADPSLSRQVQLAWHDITAEHQPYVEVTVNGVKLATVHIDLAVTVTVEALTAAVRRGRVVSVRCGQTTVGAWLGCEGHEIAGRERPFDLAVTVPVGPGIALLPSVGAAAVS